MTTTQNLDTDNSPESLNVRRTFRAMRSQVRIVTTMTIITVNFACNFVRRDKISKKFGSESTEYRRCDLRLQWSLRINLIAGRYSVSLSLSLFFEVHEVLSGLTRKYN